MNNIIVEFTPDIPTCDDWTFDCVHQPICHPGNNRPEEKEPLRPIFRVEIKASCITDNNEFSESLEGLVSDLHDIAHTRDLAAWHECRTGREVTLLTRREILTPILLTITPPMTHKTAMKTRSDKNVLLPQ